MLIVGNLYDPATRYEGAQTLRKLLPNSALLTVDGTGHTSLGLSACAGFVVGQYLLDPAVGPEVDGGTCPAEYNPFDLVAPGGAPGPAATMTGASALNRAVAGQTTISREMRRAVMAEVGRQN